MEFQQKKKLFHFFKILVKFSINIFKKSKVENAIGTFQNSIAIPNNSNYSHSNSSHQRCSIKKKLFLKILQNSQENTCATFSFLIKLQASGLQHYLKRDFGTGVFCEFCEIFDNTFFTEHLWCLLLSSRQSNVLSRRHQKEAATGGVL